MMNKDILLYSLLNFVRQKKKFILVLVCVLCTVLTASTLLVFDTINNYFSNNFKKNISYRTLIVQAKEDEIGKIDHVIASYNARYDSFGAYFSLDGSQRIGTILLKPVIVPKGIDIIYGQNLSNSFDAICPMNLYLGNTSNLNINISKEDIINVKSLIGKTFEIEYNSIKLDSYGVPHSDKTFSQIFNVVGIYKNSNAMEDANICYVSLDDVKYMKEVEGDFGDSTSFIVVDDIKNINHVREELANRGYASDFKVILDSDFILSLVLICVLITVIFTITSSLIQVLYIKKRITDDTHNIGLLRSFGYTASDVKKKYLTESLLYIIMPYIIGNIIFIILTMIINHFISFSLSIYNLPLHFSILSLIITIIGMILIPCYFSNRLISNKVKENILQLLKEEE